MWSKKGPCFVVVFVFSLSLSLLKSGWPCNLPPKRVGVMRNFNPAYMKGWTDVQTILSKPKFLGCIDNEFFLPMVLRQNPARLGGEPPRCCIINGSPQPRPQGFPLKKMGGDEVEQPTQLCPASCSRLSSLLAARDVLLTARSGDRLLYSQADNFNEAVCSNSIFFQGCARL